MENSKIVAMLVLENIFFMSLIGFLCYWFDSGWPCLLIVCMNNISQKDKDELIFNRFCF